MFQNRFEFNARNQEESIVSDSGGSRVLSEQSSCKTVGESLKYW